MSKLCTSRGPQIKRLWYVTIVPIEFQIGSRCVHIANGKVQGKINEAWSLHQNLMPSSGGNLGVEIAIWYSLNGWTCGMLWNQFVVVCHAVSFIKFFIKKTNKKCPLKKLKLPPNEHVPKYIFCTLPYFLCLMIDGIKVLARQCSLRFKENKQNIFIIFLKNIFLIFNKQGRGTSI